MRRLQPRPMVLGRNRHEGEPSMVREWGRGRGTRGREEAARRYETHTTGTKELGQSSLCYVLVLRNAFRFRTYIHTQGSSQSEGRLFTRKTIILSCCCVLAIRLPECPDFGRV